MKCVAATINGTANTHNHVPTAHPSEPHDAAGCIAGNKAASHRSFYSNKAGAGREASPVLRTNNPPPSPALFGSEPPRERCPTWIQAIS
jgi:hypothetical protein